MKKIVLLIYSILLLTLTACGDIDDDLASKSKVDKKVAAEVVNEKYSFLSVEHHDEERPKRDVYTYKSKERDMTFEVISTLMPFGIDGSVIGYKKFIDVQYAESVRKQYAKEAEEILKVFERQDDHRFIYRSFYDLKEIAEAFVKLSDLYKAELTYNTAEWMAENPFCSISFGFERVEKDGYYVSVFNIDVDGTLTYDELYGYITYKHAEAVKDGEIQDDTMPESQIQRVHEDYLKYIVYEGNDLLNNAVEKAHQDHLVNNTDSAYYSYYYYPWDCYVVILDCGLTDDKYAPKWMENYADAFGFSCNVQYKKGKIEWFFEDCQYELRAKEEKNREITEFKIYKEGKDMNIPYITHYSKLSPVGPSYVVGIPVDAFAKLFHKEYIIDEEMGKLEFRDIFPGF